MKNEKISKLWWRLFIVFTRFVSLPSDFGEVFID
jgi:hypothetical protein